jgi:hypothetical protein
MIGEPDLDLADIELFTERDSPLHEALCTAFLEWGGYATVSDHLYEVLGARFYEADVFQWGLRLARYAGRA